MVCLSESYRKRSFFFLKKKTFLSIVLYSALGTRLELVLLDSILLSKCDHDQKKKKSDMLHITFPSILYSNTAEYKQSLIDPRHSLPLHSSSFSAALIKHGKVEDTVYSHTVVKMNLPEENSSDASNFTIYPVVTSDSLTGIQTVQIQLEGGWKKRIQFFSC